MLTHVTILESDLRQLLTERDAARKQITDLQNAMSAMQEAQLSRRVRAFHLKFGHPVRTTPKVPSDAEVRFRLRLIAEEFLELLEACFGEAHDVTRETMRACIEESPLDVNLPAFVDALVDLAYVIEGGHAVCGTHAAPFFAEVQRANMAKDPNGPNGKPVKPADWTPPQIERVLREQGWRGGTISKDPSQDIERQELGLPVATMGDLSSSTVEVHADTAALHEEA